MRAAFIRTNPTTAMDLEQWLPASLRRTEKPGWIRLSYNPWGIYRKRQTWLAHYLMLGLECDFPIVESIIYAMPNQCQSHLTPKEIAKQQIACFRTWFLKNYSVRYDHANIPFAKFRHARIRWYKSKRMAICAVFHANDDWCYALILDFSDNAPLLVFDDRIRGLQWRESLYGTNYGIQIESRLEMMARLASTLPSDFRIRREICVNHSEFDAKNTIRFGHNSPLRDAVTLANGASLAYMSQTAFRNRKIVDSNPPIFEFDDDVHFCEFCDLPGYKMLRCSRCKRARYCQTGCQKEDWPRHKEECRPRSK